MPLVGGEASGNAIVEVANYSALPAANTVPGELYAVLASQGTWWLPGTLGGTYYNKGLYYSDGTNWVYTETPYNANQATVNAGTNDEQFVTPKTFNDSAQLAAKASLTGTETLTNKRITRRVTSIVSNATPTVNTDDCDMVRITAQAANITSMTANLSGTPTEGQLLHYQMLASAAYTIAWGASFEAKGQALPTVFTANKRLNVLFSWDSVTAKWGCLDAIVET